VRTRLVGGQTLSVDGCDGFRSLDEALPDGLLGEECEHDSAVLLDLTD
jgi:hypothetical protein